MKQSFEKLSMSSILEHVCAANSTITKKYTKAEIIQSMLYTYKHSGRGFDIVISKYTC